jgi:hypothetical protein
MPANHGNIFRFGLADAKFVRHASKGSVAASTLASKDRSILRGYFDRNSKETSCS